MRPPGQTSRKGAGLGANKRRAGPGGWRRAPLARAHHPPSGGPMSGAVVRSSARGTWRASGAYPQCPNHPGRWGEPADTIRKAPGGPSQQHRTQILAVETSWRLRDLCVAQPPRIAVITSCPPLVISGHATRLDAWRFCSTSGDPRYKAWCCEAV